MKTILSITCGIVLLGCVTPAYAIRDPLAVTADALLARPLCFAATIIGSAIFVVSLPVAATSGSIDSTADALVREPAWWTFKRPMGDFGSGDEYSSQHPAKHKHHRFAHSPKNKTRTEKSRPHK